MVSHVLDGIADIDRPWDNFVTVSESSNKGDILMVRVSQWMILAFLGAVSFATTTEKGFCVSPTTEEGENGPKAAADARKHADTKVLVAFDPYSGRRADSKKRRAEFDQALKKSKVKIVAKHHYDNYLLLDCGARKPATVLAEVPHHAGAIVFCNGNLVDTIPSHDRKRTPKKYAILRWGSSANAMKQMKADINKYSSMPGVVAKKVNLAPGKHVFGNPFILKLTPSEGKTLLEIFLMAEAQFDHVEAKTK